MWKENRQRTRDPWSTRKKDVAPRGVYRHRSGMWAIRFTCGAGHIHKEQVGRVKSDAIDARSQRRARARWEPGWPSRATSRPLAASNRPTPSGSMAASNSPPGW